MTASPSFRPRQCVPIPRDPLVHFFHLTARPVFDTAQSSRAKGSVLNFVHTHARGDYMTIRRDERDRRPAKHNLTALLLGDPKPGRSAQDALDGAYSATTGQDILALYYSGEPTAEIARRLHVPPAAVTGVLRRFRDGRNNKREPHH